MRESVFLIIFTIICVKITFALCSCRRLCAAAGWQNSRVSTLFTCNSLSLQATAEVSSKWSKLMTVLLMNQHPRALHVEASVKWFWPIFSLCIYPPCALVYLYIYSYIPPPLPTPNKFPSGGDFSPQPAALWRVGPWTLSLNPPPVVTGGERFGRGF